MIHSVNSDLSTFKEQRFHGGLNILLADRTAAATDKQSRNSAGKTSLVEIVHFVLGSDIRKGSLFKADALQQASFSLDLDLGGRRVTAERLVANHTRIKIAHGETAHWPIQPAVDRETGESFVSLTDWKKILARMMFTFGEDNDLAADEKGRPSFRSLISYFARRASIGGFMEPARWSTDQQVGNQQVSLSFLLGLDWTIPQRLETVRERAKTMKALRKAIGVGAGFFGNIFGWSAELRKQLALAESKAKRIAGDLANFLVHPQYHDLEKEASEVNRKLKALSNENALDLAVVADLEAAGREEAQALDYAVVQRLYDQAKVVLPDSVAKRFDDVRRFHESVISNRRSYLDGELSSLRDRVAHRTAEMRDLDSRQSKIMAILKSHGALDQYTLLQSELNRIEGEAESLRQRHKAAEEFEHLKTTLEIERKQLHLRLQQDYEEQSNVINDALVWFEEISQALYEKAGSFLIEKTDNGPAFTLKTPGDRGIGIQHMQIFCFDMMMMKVLASKNHGPGFLIHDSHLFDGVDARQIAHALKVGAEFAEAHQFQYLVTMNSDTLPVGVIPGFDVEQYVLTNRLTDETETGGLFGMRFE